MPDIDYHLSRARAERHIAYVSPHPVAADTHMRLSALHLGRALLLQEVQRHPVGNVVPLRPVAPVGAQAKATDYARNSSIVLQGEAQ